MASKCEVFMNCNKNFTGAGNNQILLTNKEYLWGHKCERTNLAYKYKIFEAVDTSQVLGICIYTHLCRISKDIGVHKERKL